MEFKSAVFSHNVLEISEGIDHLGGIQWKLFGCLVAAVLIVFLCIIKGIKSVGKVVYMTSSVPYIFLTILLIRGLTLPGALDGIYYYVTPEWHRLLEFRVWVEACLQIFYSLGPGWGSLITMASYNRFHKKMHIDALLVPLINCGTSFYAGFVIFSIIGFMANDAGLAVKDVVASGPGLAFIAYPEALNKLPFPAIWSILFFVMLLNIGLGSQFSMVQTVVSSFLDRCPGVLKVFKRKWIFTAFVCLAMCLCSFIFVTKAGIYYFQVVDWYCAAFTVSLITVLECIVVSLIYGIKRFRYDIECMIGKKPNVFLSSMWICVTPLLIVIVLMVSMSDFPEPYYGDYTYPAWAVAMGWGIATVSLVPIPVVAIRRLTEAQGSLLQRLRSATKPAKEWGPALPKHRENYKYCKKHYFEHKTNVNSLEIEKLNSYV